MISGHCSQLRIKYSDVDRMGIVWHGRYLEYFEYGRTEWLRALGMPYAGFEERGLLILVLQASLTCIAPARYDQVVDIDAGIAEMPGARMRIDYEIRHDSELLVTGFTLHAFADRTSMRPVRPPKDFLERLMAAGRA